MMRALRTAGILSMAIPLGIMRKAHAGIWSPSMLPGIVEWWDWQTQIGNDGDPVAASTGVIAANQFVQAVSASKPTLRASGINGHRAIQLTTDDFMSCDGLAAGMQGSDIPFTWLGVYQLDAIGAETAICIARNAASVSRHQIGANASQQYLISRRDELGGSVSQAAAVAQPTTPVAFAQRFNGTTVDFFVGVGATNLIAKSMDTTALTLNRFTIGCTRVNANSSFMTGYWGELVYCLGAVDLGSIQNWFTYAAARWGTS